MSNLLIRWAVLSLSLFVAASVTNLLMPGSFRLEGGWGGALQLLLGVAFLAFLNATLGRVLKFFTAPLNCLTLGLVSLLINASMLLVAGQAGLGYSIPGGFWAALVGSLILSVVNGLLGAVLLKDKDEESER